MTLFGIIGITSPWLLLALAALPILWVLLRAVPPAPIKRRFPGVALLLGLQDDQVETDKTPWWLLILRAAIVGALIIGFAGPVLNPTDQTDSDGPLLVVMDGTWAEAGDWDRRQEKAVSIIESAGRQGRAVAFATLTNPETIDFNEAQIASRAAKSAQPQTWAPDLSDDWLAGVDGAFETYWLASPIEWDGKGQVLETLSDRGAVTVYDANQQTFGLRPPKIAEGGIEITALRATPMGNSEVTVNALGLDPSGVERVLETSIVQFASGETVGTGVMEIPAELRNRVTRMAVVGQSSAGAVTLTDDRLKRREIALISDQVGGQESLALLSPLHYLRQALAPSADLIDGTLTDILLANPDIIILADVARVAQESQLIEWVENGGLLLRFAGPRLAAASFDQLEEDVLMPVRLRAGGRTVGGAMSWGAPKTLQAFDAETPFFGLPVPDEVTVSAQVLAEPGPNLANRVIARLGDGTPLVTHRELGQGRVVLYHVTANAEWSNLPLSGLFMSMLERLSVLENNTSLDAAELDGTLWQLDQQLDGFGQLQQAGDRPSVDGIDLADAKLSGDLPAGLYAGQDRRLARNVVTQDGVLEPTIWPNTVRIDGPASSQPKDLSSWLLLGALALAALDLIVSLGLSGKLRGAVSAAVFAVIFGATGADQVRAQDATDRALAATGAVVLAYVITGDDRQDEVSRAGLLGLSQTLFQRTSIEPIAPVGVELDRDELAFYPFLYWPITLNQTRPSEEVRAKLNRYVKGGGMILFDTRDAELAQFGRSTKEGRLLQEIAAGLNIPPIAQIASDHVLTRTFYLLQEFPGRSAGGTIWVEAPRSDVAVVEGMPFRNLNDGVTPVVIGGNDWAAAWAVDNNGQPLLPVGRGYAGERQREIARRFGVNLIMHVLTGNYKSDQVHVPALLDRLGQ